MPEKRLRFAQPCIQEQCAHWHDSRCDVADAAVAQVPSAAESLPRCSIRAECRWFAQRGREACRVCPFVVTDVVATPGATTAPIPRTLPGAVTGPTS